jgi:NAD(P)-dependent dehydrogenase (short-subunit alcohol dehydrogenase family)
VRLCEEAGAEVLAGEVDIRDLEAVSAFATEARAKFGKLDVLLGGAGIFTAGPVAHMDPKVWAEMIEVNLTGTWNTVRAVVPAMEERGYGRVVLTASAGAVIAMPETGHYCAAKHGVLGMAKALAQEVGKAGITVNVICPTAVLTPMIDNDEWYAMLGATSLEEAGEVMSGISPMGVPWVQPADVTAYALFLASEEARYISGAPHLIDMAMTAS